MDEKTDTLIFGAGKGFKKGVVEKIRTNVEKDVAREIAQRRPPILLADLKGSRLGSFFQELFQPLSEVEISRCFPLARSGKLVGLINTSKGQTGQIIRESAHRLVFGTICDRVAVAVENAQLFRHVEQQLKELLKHREHLEELVEERTAELRKMVNLMADREIRMAELKETIKKLREQIEEAGMTPVADDSLREGGSQESDA